METDRLIETLALDARQAALPLRCAWVVAALAAAAVALAVFLAALGPRADFAAAAETLRFLFKFVVTLALFGTAFAALVALSRPDARPRRVLPLLLVPLGLILAAVAAELAALPATELAARWRGANAVLCLTFIPLIGLGPLAVFLATLRHGAPTRASLSGAIAGLAAGGLAATLYAAHCTDDSPLFVATWYTLAIALLAGLGAIGGRIAARW